jgi:hypothetical protein
MTATVTSSAGDAALTVADPSATAPGHLLNGTFALASPLQAKATSAGGAGSALQSVGAAPATLLRYVVPVGSDAVTLGFSQAIAATEGLRTGTYANTLVFTLSTTTP